MKLRDHAVEYEPVTRSSVRRRSHETEYAELERQLPSGKRESRNEGKFADRGLKPLGQHETLGWKSKVWSVKYGHTLSYAGLFLFTAVLYFRPYELFPALSAFRTIAFWIALPTLLIFFPTQLSLEGNLTARPREVNLILLFIVARLIG